MRSEIQSIRESVTRIEVSLIGDPAMGHKGFAERLVAVERKTDENDRKLLLWGGIATGASVVISKFWTKLSG